MIMEVPIWLGYLMLTAFSLALIVVGLYILIALTGVIINELIPKLWLSLHKFRVKNFSKEQLEAYIVAIRTDWTTLQIRKKQKADD